MALFLAVPWVSLQFVIVVFPDHTHLLFLHNDCPHNEDVQLIYHAHFTNIFVSFGGGGGGLLNLDIFSLEMFRWFLVCVICNFKSFHSFIFNFCIMIVPTLNTCLSFLCKSDNYFFLFLWLFNLDIFPSEIFSGVWFVKSVTQAVFI